MTKTILVVDDSETMLRMNSLILTQAGYAVKTALDGRQALELFDGEIDAVVTDFNMPHMSGEELIQAIRNGPVNQRVPIVLATTENERDHVESIAESSADGWLKKPFKKDELTKTVSSLF